MAPPFGGLALRRQGTLMIGTAMCIFGQSVHIGCTMRTNIDIDEKLLAKAMAAAGKKTKKDKVYEACG
jgi:hypothetical protein